RPEGATDNELFSAGYNMAQFRATAGLPIPDKADLDLGDPFWRGFHDGVADHNAHGERTRQIAAGTAPELKDPVGWDTLDPFAVGSEASLNEPAGAEPVDPLDALLREFLESLEEIPELPARDGEEEEEEEEETGGRAAGSGDTADAEMTLVKSAEEPPALPSGVVETGVGPGGGRLVQSSRIDKLTKAGAIHIRRDANGQYVGVIPSEGPTYFLDPFNNKETFVKWMVLAGHTEKEADKYWDTMQAEREKVRIATEAMKYRFPLLAKVEKFANFLDAVARYLAGKTEPSPAPPSAGDGPFVVDSGNPLLWYDKDQLNRGRVIEKLLGKNTPGPYPKIDRWDDETVIDRWDEKKGIAISIKSMDTHVQSYVNPGDILSRGRGYIKDVAAFQGGRMGATNIERDKIKVRGLDLAVPARSTEEQWEALQKLVEEAKKVGVKVRIITVL
ncbi:MAG: hypothetical protein V2B18_01610, partial [Pseudomonadota bacterium]